VSRRGRRSRRKAQRRRPQPQTPAPVPGKPPQRRRQQAVPSVAASAEFARRARRVRGSLAAALAAPAAYIFYFLGSQIVYMLRAGSVFAGTMVAYFWYLVVAGLAAYAALALVRGRFPSRSVWRWLLGLALPSAALFGYALWYELARRADTLAWAVVQLSLGLAAFLCIAALAGLQLSVWQRLERDAPGRAGGRRARDRSSPGTPPRGAPPPGTPLY